MQTLSEQGADVAATDGDLVAPRLLAHRLLAPDEPSPVEIVNAHGRSPFLLLCDHAGRLVPRRLGDLGVTPADMERHIAWDIGIMATSRLLAAALDAAIIAQRYSRLVIDCNRAPGHPTSIPPMSDGTAVPGNAGLTPAETAARTAEVFDPYHAAIAAELDRRGAAETDRRGAAETDLRGAAETDLRGAAETDLRGRCVVVAMHSFTPVFGGVARPWEAGVLHDRDPAYALEVGRQLAAAGLVVGDNEPYRLTDDSDYTVPVHAERRALPYVELEIRQDLLAEASGQRRWAALLAEVLPAAWSAVGGAS